MIFLLALSLITLVLLFKLVRIEREVRIKEKLLYKHVEMKSEQLETWYKERKKLLIHLQEDAL
jgi:hypothetical protein